MRLQWAAHTYTSSIREVFVGGVFSPAFLVGKNNKAQLLPTTQGKWQGQGEKSQGQDVQLFRTLFYLYLRRDTRKRTPRGLGTGCDLEVTVNKPRPWQGTARGTSQAFRSGLWGGWKSWNSGGNLCFISQDLLVKPIKDVFAHVITFDPHDNTEGGIYLFIHLFIYLLIGCPAWLVGS